LSDGAEAPCGLKAALQRRVEWRVVLERVLATIRRHQMLAPGMRVIAAVSGGPDSVCLLHVLRELGIELAGVAHFNHKLRGEASDGDERFVAELARQIGLPFHREEGGARHTADNLEQALRRARRGFFARLLRGGLAERVALGHTLDDQAETVLFRLLRGSGLAGLAGILPITADGIIRPLLDVRRSEVEEFLRERGIAWREDASNWDPAFARNRIRHALLPQLTREWNPRLTENLGQLADLAHDEERWWAAEVAGLVTERDGSVELEAAALAGVPRALGRRVARHAVRLARGRLEGIAFGHIERVLDLAARPEGEGRVALPGLKVERSFAWVRFAKSGGPVRVEPQSVKEPGVYRSPDGKSLIQIEVVEQPHGSGACDTLRVDCGSAPLELRGWKPGDRYRPVGRDRDYKIRDLFQQARVPSWKRAFWPILTGNGKILWARGWGIAAESVEGSGATPLRKLRIRETSKGE